MPRKSSIEALPPETRAKVDALIRAGEYSIDGLRVIILNDGHDASRSSVGRYAHNKKKAMELYSEAQEMAKSLTARFQEDPNSDVGRMLAQVLRGITYNTMSVMAADDGKAKPNELMLLSAAIKNLAGADKIALDQAIRIRKQMAEEIDKKVTELAKQKTTTGAPLISPEALTAIRGVYGIEPEKP